MDQDTLASAEGVTVRGRGRILTVRNGCLQRYERMPMHTGWCFTGGLVVILSALGCGSRTTSVDSGRVLPTIYERPRDQVVTGTLITKDGSDFVVRETVSDLQPTVYVNQQTQQDAMTTGETVRIYFTEDSHVTTVQRITE